MQASTQMPTESRDSSASISYSPATENVFLTLGRKEAKIIMPQFKADESNEDNQYGACPNWLKINSIQNQLAI